MLALCWLIFRSWALLGRILRFVLRFLSLLVVFFTFWTVLGSILEGLEGVGEGFEGSKRLFFDVFLCARACNAKKLRMCKNHCFSYGF